MMEWTKNIGNVLKNSLLAILEGKFLLRLHIHKYYVHILCTFVVIGAVIWVSLAIDNTLAKVERSKKTLHEIRIKHTEKTFDLAEQCRRESVEQNLKRMGSDLKAPSEPATRIRKK